MLLQWFHEGSICCSARAQPLQETRRSLGTMASALRALQHGETLAGVHGSTASRATTSSRYGSRSRSRQGLSVNPSAHGAGACSKLLDIISRTVVLLVVEVIL